MDLLDGKNSSVHHVGGGNDVRPSLGKIILDATILDAIMLDAIMLDARKLAAKDTLANASAWLARAALLALASMLPSASEKER